jgi:hypothetical protein
MAGRNESERVADLDRNRWPECVGIRTHQPRPECYDPPGFFSGLFHGFIILILFSLLGSIFMDIRIYAFPNSGFFYDLGFLIGAAGFFGGAGASS